MELTNNYRKALRVSKYIIRCLTSFKYFYALYILFISILFVTIISTYDSSSQLTFDQSLYLLGSGYSAKLIISQLLFLYTLLTIIFASISFNNIMYGHNFEVLITSGYSRTLVLSTLMGLVILSSTIFFIPFIFIPGSLFLYFNLVIHSVLILLFVLTLSLIVENVSGVILLTLLHYIFFSYYLTGVDTSSSFFGYFNYFIPNIFESYLNIPQSIGKIDSVYYVKLITSISTLVALSYLRVRRLES